MADPRMLIDDLRRRISEEDGHLPNGRALGVGDTEWRAFLAALRTSGWPTTWDDKEITEWPAEVADVRRDDHSALRIEVENVVLVRIFPGWGTDDIWFDFDLRELYSQENVDHFFLFVRLIGRSTGRPVALSYEGADEQVFASYDPDADSLDWSDAANG